MPSQGRHILWPREGTVGLCMCIPVSACAQTTHYPTSECSSSRPAPNKQASAGELTHAPRLLQFNLFLAVLKIKFGKAQTIFKNRVANMTKKQRKNLLSRIVEKSKTSISSYTKKQRSKGQVAEALRSTNVTGL